MTVAFWSFDAGAPLPEHSHPHEQVMMLMEGKFEFVVDGQKEIHEPGSVVVISPNIPHSGKAVTFCKIVDVFHPQREEYR